MRHLNMYYDTRIRGEVIDLMSLGSTDGVLCPGLRSLYWWVVGATVPLHRLLLSTKLTALSLIHLPSDSPEGELSVLQPVIVGLDTFHLRDLHIQWWIFDETSVQMESATSSAVLRCGPALEKLTVVSPLSDAAIQYIMQLPNLRTWHTASGPPSTPNLSLSDIFPRLDHLSLAVEKSLEWITLFTKTPRRIPSGQSSHPSLKHGPAQRLTLLDILPNVTIDTVFMSRVIQFRELTILRLKSACSHLQGCVFNLTDDDIAEIATALPHLEEAVLGRVCSANSCQTTIESLVFLSTRCRDLRVLEVHFNTTYLRNDLEFVLTDHLFHDLPTRRTSDNFHLSLSRAPCGISGDDFALVLMGFRRIFPSLSEISGNDASWEELCAFGVMTGQFV